MRIDGRKFLDGIILAFFVISAFTIRLDVFKKSAWGSIDEVVYYRMGTQVAKNWADYHTIPYAHKLKSEGRDLPKYFFQPLYKHPPLFTFFIASSMKIFGTKGVPAASVAIFFGVLMIPLTYLLGTLLFSRMAGIVAAFFVYIDPVMIMSSQKIWPDTTMAFFMVLTVYLFALGVKKSRDGFFIWAGIALGGALLVKYSGGLPLAAVILYAVFYDRALFKNKKFILGFFIIPLVMLTPWFLWNLAVYGITAVGRHTELRLVLEKVFTWPVFVAFVLGGLGFWSYKKYRHFFDSRRFYLSRMARAILPPVAVLIFCFILKDHVIRALRFDYIPVCSWDPAGFAEEPWYFYFGRLVEYSLVYLFAFVALVMPRSGGQKARAVARLFVFVTFGFYVVWGAYQSRYILASIPCLLVWAAGLGDGILKGFLQKKDSLGAATGLIAMAVLLVYVVLRTYHINVFLSYTNNMCYF